MKRNLKEANYNLSISDLNTTDGDALSQILAMASQADDEVEQAPVEDTNVVDPYAGEYEDGLDNGSAVDTPFDVTDSETPTELANDYVEYDNSISQDTTDGFDFNIDDYKQYGIDENDFNEPEEYSDELLQGDESLINEAEGQKGYSIMVKGKSYGFLPTDNEYSDEEIKNQFLKQYISEKGEEFPYADEITIVKKDNVDEDLLLSKDESDPTNVSAQKINDFDKYPEEFEDTNYSQLDENWVETAPANEPHSGWSNAQTWNVALELENNYDLYMLKSKYSKEHPDATYDDFIRDTGLANQKTTDGIKFSDKRLNKDELTKDVLHRQFNENEEFEDTAMNGEEYIDASIEEQINQALFNAGVISESDYSPKLAEPKKKKPNQANYQDVNIDADSKAGTLGFEDNANPSEPVRSQQNKPAKIVETAQRLLAKAPKEKKEKLQTRFIYKLMNEGYSYSKSKNIILKLK